MEIVVGFLIAGTLFVHFLVFLQRYRARKRTQAEYKIRLAQQQEQLRDYMMDPDLLRGHDLVASFWVEEIRHQPPNPEMEGLVLAAATVIEHHEGRHYEGRPIQRGWMTEQDYQEYFHFLDQAGSFKERYAAIFRTKAALADR